MLISWENSYCAFIQETKNGFVKFRSPIILPISLPSEFTIKVIGIPLNLSSLVSFNLLSKWLTKFFTFNLLKNFWILSYLIFSILINTMLTWLLGICWYKLSNSGNSFLHGAHQVAQKFINVNFDEKSLKIIVFPFLLITIILAILSYLFMLYYLNIPKLS